MGEKEIKLCSKESIKKFLFGTCVWEDEHKTVKEEQPSWDYCPKCGELLPTNYLSYEK